MGAIFERREMKAVDYVDDEDGEIVLHRSTGKAPYPAGEYHAPIWGHWYRDAPMWTRGCMFDYAHGNGANQGCDLEEHTFTNPDITEEPS